MTVWSSRAEQETVSSSSYITSASFNAALNTQFAWESSCTGHSVFVDVERGRTLEYITPVLPGEPRPAKAEPMFKTYEKIAMCVSGTSSPRNDSLRAVLTG